MDSIHRDLSVGPPMLLDEFHLWFKGGALWRAGHGEIPYALAAWAPGQARPSITEFVITGRPSSAVELIAKLIGDWIEQSEASQVALCLPLAIDADNYELFLVSLNGAGVVAERAAFTREGQMLSLDTQGLEGTWWPIGDWKSKLARHERLAADGAAPARSTASDPPEGPGF